MENLGSDSQRFGKRFRTNGLDHKLLNIDVIVRVLTTIEDIHHRHRHGELCRTSEVGNVLIKRRLRGLCSCSSRC